jgi:hypothetical protein
MEKEQSTLEAIKEYGSRGVLEVESTNAADKRVKLQDSK